jgi:hypothetical protein
MPAKYLFLSPPSFCQSDHKSDFGVIGYTFIITIVLDSSMIWGFGAAYIYHKDEDGCRYSLLVDCHIYSAGRFNRLDHRPLVAAYFNDNRANDVIHIYSVFFPVTAALGKTTVYPSQTPCLQTEYGSYNSQFSGERDYFHRSGSPWFWVLEHHFRASDRCRCFNNCLLGCGSLASCFYNQPIAGTIPAPLRDKNIFFEFNDRPAS